METIDKYPPSHPLLKHVVSSIVFWRRSADCTGSIITLPINVSGFGFTLSGEFHVKTGTSFNKMPAFGTRNLYEKPGEIITKGAFLNISVRCTIPNGLCLFTKIPMNIIYGVYAVSLDDIFTGQEILDLTEQLAEATTDSERLGLIESFLVSRIVNSYPPLFGEIARFIHRSKGFYNLTYIAKLFHVSERTINRYFNKYLGISPIVYINLIRFRSMLSISGQDGVTLLSSAFDAGYYDQSHFIKHFKEFSSLTPARFFSAKRNKSLSDFYNL